MSSNDVFYTMMSSNDAFYTMINSYVNENAIKIEEEIPCEINLQLLILVHQGEDYQHIWYDSIDHSCLVRQFVYPIHEGK